jgi:hypothetical protein
MAAFSSSALLIAVAASDAVAVVAQLDIIKGKMMDADVANRAEALAERPRPAHARREVVFACRAPVVRAHSPAVP